MATSEHHQQLGFLHALEDDGSTLKNKILPIPLFKGLNSIGRDDIVSASKQVSRKHASIEASSDGSFELSVVGQNPVVIKSGSVKRKLSPNARTWLVNGDILEFLPGKLPYKLMSEPTQEEPVLSSGPDVRNVSSRKTVFCQVSESRSSALVVHERATSATTKKREWEAILVDSDENEQVTKKQKQQLIDDEALARALQDEEDRAARASAGGHASLLNGQHAGTSSSPRPRVADNEEGSFGIEYEAGCRSSSTFRLMQVKGLPQWANKGCVNIRGVIQGDIQVALLSNYMVDIDWLLEACPRLKTVPSVAIFHGEGGGSLELLQASKPHPWLLHKPPLRLSYGTHHSKAMFLVYPTGVRIVVHTANLIYIDWNNKSQGLWMQDFPYKSAPDSKPSPFENDLVEYLQALEWGGCMAAVSGLGEVRINAAFFRRFDYSGALVRLVGSIPGYHQGRNLTKWGHLKLRTILQEQCFEEQFKGAPCICQFSSLGSLDEKWVGEFASSLQAGCTFGKEKLGPGPFQIIWPTVEDIRRSIEGYAAGGAVPSPLKNVERPFLSKYWSRWQADHTGRSRAIPHIKTFARYNDQSLAWFLLTSSNLSKAAWGALQKNDSQLMIRSYELGVLFLPSLIGTNSNDRIPFSCTYSSSALPKELQFKAGDESKEPVGHPKLVTLSWKRSSDGEHDRDVIVRLPLPYALPPSKYGPGDTPWSWDRQYTQPDVHGEVWPRQVRRYSTQT